jgi:hypothetical protein
MSLLYSDTRSGNMTDRVIVSRHPAAEFALPTEG